MRRSLFFRRFVRFVLKRMAGLRLRLPFMICVGWTFMSREISLRFSDLLSHRETRHLLSERERFFLWGKLVPESLLYGGLVSQTIIKRHLPL